jgi:hypothetical protein
LDHGQAGTSRPTLLGTNSGNRMTNPKISNPDDQQAEELLRLALIDAEHSGVSQRTVRDVARQARQRCVDEWKSETHGIPLTS